MAVVLALCLASSAICQRILLVPLDSRPASGQFAQMIGKIADADVRMPPYESLGRFTTPGNPERILNWLESQDLSNTRAIIASADMIAYGGLIASRADGVSVEVATRRLRRFANLKLRAPDIKLYMFSATMRLAPTATRQSASWRMNLARAVELDDKTRRTGSETARAEMRRQLELVPKVELARYQHTRRRNFIVQKALVEIAAGGGLDYLVIGQDDAKPYGPHVGETIRLKAMAENTGAVGSVFFCEGIDQHSNILLSRALLKQNNWTPRVRIVFSDPEAAKQFASFESKPIFQSLDEQLYAAGARPMGEDGFYDYTLFVNTPKPRPDSFDTFASVLGAEIDQGLPVAVADINLANDGTADPRLFELLTQADRGGKLLSFAGWNTAGNTMGTSIPAANVYLLAKRLEIDPLRREIAQHEFLLHRYVNDYAYHKFTRPQAYRLLDVLPNASREETNGESFAVLNSFVQRDLGKYLGSYFREQFFGRKFQAGNRSYEFSSIDDVKIWLPWPRAYEVRIEFKLTASPD
jgi:hypothetical protein